MRCSTATALLAAAAWLVAGGEGGNVRVSSFGANVRVASFSGTGSAACAGSCNATCPCDSLQRALHAAAEGDTVLVLPPPSGAPIPCERAVVRTSVTVQPHPAASQPVVFDCAQDGWALWFNGSGNMASTLRRATLRHVEIRHGSCSCVRADEFALALEQCSFLGCRCAADALTSTGGAVVVSVVEPAEVAELSISDCLFRSGHAGFGGAVHIASTAAQLRVAVLRSRFAGNSAAYDGGALAVAFRGDRLASAQVLVEESVFEENTSMFAGGAVSLTLRVRALHNASVRVSRSTFRDNWALNFGGAVAVKVTEAANVSDVRMAVTQCSFLNNVAATYHGGGVNVDVSAQRGERASLSVTGSSFAEQRAGGSGGGVAAAWTFTEAANCSLRVAGSSFADGRAGWHGAALYLDAESVAALRVAVEDCEFRNHTAARAGGAVVVRSVNPRAARRSVRLARCRFQDSDSGDDAGAVGIILGGDDCPHAEVNVTDCTFLRSFCAERGGALSVALEGTGSPGTALAVTNCTFLHTRAGREGGALHVNAALLSSADLRAEVRGCRFLDSAAGDRGGAVYAGLARVPGPVLPLPCLPTAQWRELRWEASSELLLERCVLRNASATSAHAVGGGVAVVSGRLVMRDCNAVGVHANYSGGFLAASAGAEVLLVRTRVEAASAHVAALLQHEGVGALTVRDCTLLPANVAWEALEVEVAAAATASRLQLVNTSLACRPGQPLRNASRGLALASQVWPRSRFCTGPYVVQDVVLTAAIHMAWQCVPCPAGSYFLGAGAMQGGQARWGECTRCPFGATCPGQAAVQAAAGMWGTPLLDVSAAGEAPLLPDRLLRCAEGYCCAGGDECARFDSCAPTRAGFLCGDCLPGYTSVLGSMRCRWEADCGGAAPDVLFWPGSALAALALAAWQVHVAGVRARQAEAAGGAALAPGVTKAAFAYYQCLPLLLLGDLPTSTAAALRGLLQPVLMLFSFQLQLSGGSAGVCPLPGLTPVSKQVLAAAAAAAAVLVLPLLQLLHAALAWFGPRLDVRCLWRRSQGGVLLALHPPCAQAYAGALTSLLTLTYSALATAVFALLTCVSVPSHGSRLLLQGSVRCWTAAAWWQWVALAWCCFSTALVPAALVLGGRLLRRGAVTPRWFWTSLLLPLPCLAWWACAGRRQAASRELGMVGKSPAGAARLRQGAVAALEAGYRPGMWWWDAVLLLRRLLLAALPLLLNQQPLLQALAGASVVALSLLLHTELRPFAHRTANTLESCFLVALLLVSCASVRAAALMSAAAADPAAGHDTLVAVMLGLLVTVFPLGCASVLLVRACARCLRARRGAPPWGRGGVTVMLGSATVRDRLLETKQ